MGGIFKRGNFNRNAYDILQVTHRRDLWNIIAHIAVTSCGFVSILFVANSPTTRLGATFGSAMSEILSILSFRPNYA